MIVLVRGLAITATGHRVPSCIARLIRYSNGPTPFILNDSASLRLLSYLEQSLPQLPFLRRVLPAEEAEIASTNNLALQKEGLDAEPEEGV